MTDHRAHRGDESRSSAVADGRTAPSTLSVSSPSTTANDRIGPVEVYRLDRGTARRQAHVAARDGEGEFGVCGRVDDDVDRHGMARVSRAGPARRRRSSAPPSSTRTTTMPGGTSSPITERMAFAQSPVTANASKTGRQGEAGPPEEVGELLVAPVPRTSLEEPVVVGKRLDCLGRHIQR